MIVLPLRRQVSRLSHYAGGPSISRNGEVVLAAAVVRRCRPANTRISRLAPFLRRDLEGRYTAA